MMGQSWEKIRIGAKISDHFMIMRALEPAGGGPVFSCMDIRTKRLFQSRFFSEENIRDHGELERRIAEARNLHETCGPIVTLPVEHGIHEGIPYVIHDFAKLRTLDEALRSGKVLSDGEVKHLMDQLFKLLIKVHAEGSVHLGLSPLAIHQRGSEFVTTEPGIIDFCLAPKSGPSYFSFPSTGSSKLATVAAYASPEQAALGKNVDHRSDLYSLGALIYRFATGTDPFQGNTAEQVLYKVISQTPSALVKERTRLPDEIAEFLSRALEKDPDRRYQEAGEMLESFIGTIPGRIVRTSLMPAPRVSLDGDEAVKFVPPPAPTMPVIVEKGEARAPSDSRPGPRPDRAEKAVKKPKAPEPTPLPSVQPAAATDAAPRQEKTARPKKPLAPPLPLKPDRAEPKKTSKPPSPPASGDRAAGLKEAFLPAEAAKPKPLGDRPPVKPVSFPFPPPKAAEVKIAKKTQADLLEREISVQVESGVDFHIDIDELMEEDSISGRPVEQESRAEPPAPAPENLVSKDILDKDPHHMVTMPAIPRKPDEVDKILKSAGSEMGERLREQKVTVEKRDASRWIWIALGIIFVGLVCAIGYFKILKSRSTADSSTKAAGGGKASISQQEGEEAESGEVEEAPEEEAVEQPEEKAVPAEKSLVPEDEVTEEPGPGDEAEEEPVEKGPGVKEDKKPSKKKKQKDKKKKTEEKPPGMRFID